MGTASAEFPKNNNTAKTTDKKMRLLLVFTCIGYLLLAAYNTVDEMFQQIICPKMIFYKKIF
jgi:hypothetical protein